jgi:hypothetical protein
MFFAAAFCTRSQVASQLRDTPEPAALRSFSVMATSTILAQMSACGINLPVFGVMLDRNIVRFHVDWSMVALGVSVLVIWSSGMGFDACRYRNTSLFLFHRLIIRSQDCRLSGILTSPFPTMLFE